MYRLILTDKADLKTEMEFEFNKLTDLIQFMGNAFQAAKTPLVATIGEEDGGELWRK